MHPTPAQTTLSTPTSPGNQTDTSAHPPMPSGSVTTDFLFQGHAEIRISHHSEHYRLRITKNNKLILTK